MRCAGDGGLVPGGLGRRGGLGQDRLALGYVGGAEAAGSGDLCAGLGGGGERPVVGGQAQGSGCGVVHLLDHGEVGELDLNLVVFDLSIERDAGGLRILGRLTVGQWAGDAQAHEGCCALSVESASLGVLGDGPGQSGLAGFGAGGYFGALTGGEGAVPIPVHPAGDLGAGA